MMVLGREKNQNHFYKTLKSYSKGGIDMGEVKNWLKAVLCAIIFVIVIFFMFNKMEVGDPTLCIAIIALITAYQARFENKNK